jgi:hypothetical protein
VEPAIIQGEATMDITAVNSLSESTAIDAGVTPGSSLYPDDLSIATDDQLIALAAKGNTRAILELEKRHAARVASPLASGDQPVPAVEQADRSQVKAALVTTAEAVTLDAPAILGLEQPDAAQAAKLLASADETVAAAAEEAVGNMLDKFV